MRRCFSCQDLISNSNPKYKDVLLKKKSSLDKCNSLLWFYDFIYTDIVVKDFYTRPFSENLVKVEKLKPLLKTMSISIEILSKECRYTAGGNHVDDLIYFNKNSIETDTKQYIIALEEKFYTASLLKDEDYFLNFGSVFHKGFINSLFKLSTKPKSYIKMVRTWIYDIGMFYDEKNLKKIVHNNVKNVTRVYKNGLTVREIYVLSKYCQKMFGVDKLSVASVFPKTNPTRIIKKIAKAKNDIEKGMYMRIIAAIYGEENKIDKTLILYEKALNTHSSPSLTSSYTLFINYVTTKGTSVLSGRLFDL